MNCVSIRVLTTRIRIKQSFSRPILVQQQKSNKQRNKTKLKAETKKISQFCKFRCHWCHVKFVNVFLYWKATSFSMVGIFVLVRQGQIMCPHISNAPYFASEHGHKYDKIVIQAPESNEMNASTWFCKLPLARWAQRCNILIGSARRSSEFFFLTWETQICHHPRLDCLWGWLNMA